MRYYLVPNFVHFVKILFISPQRRNDTVAKSSEAVRTLNTYIEYGKPFFQYITQLV